MVAASCEEAAGFGGPVGDFKALAVDFGVAVFVAVFLAFDFAFFSLLLFLFFGYGFFFGFVVKDEGFDFGEVYVEALSAVV